MKVTEAVVVEPEVLVKVEAEDIEVFEKIEHPERKGNLEKIEAQGLIEAPEKIDLLELKVKLIEVAEAPERIDLPELKVNLIEVAEAPEKIDLPELKVKPIVVAEAPEKIDLPELKERLSAEVKIDQDDLIEVVNSVEIEHPELKERLSAEVKIDQDDLTEVVNSVEIELPELMEKPIEVEEAEVIEDLELKKVNMLMLPKAIEAAEVDSKQKDDHSITTKVALIAVEERDDHMHHVHMMDTA